MVRISDLKPGETGYTRTFAAAIADKDVWIDPDHEVRRICDSQVEDSEFDLRLVRHPNGLFYADFGSDRHTLALSQRSACHVLTGGELVAPGGIKMSDPGVGTAFCEEGKNYVGKLPGFGSGWVKLSQCWFWNKRVWIDGYNEISAEQTEDFCVLLTRFGKCMYVLNPPCNRYALDTWPDIGPQFPIEIFREPRLL